MRLTKKLATSLNGLDLRAFAVGDVIDVEPSFARMLLAEGWAESLDELPARADDRPRRRNRRTHAG